VKTVRVVVRPPNGLLQPVAADRHDREPPRLNQVVRRQCSNREICLLQPTLQLPSVFAFLEVQSLFDPSNRVVLEQQQTAMLRTKNPVIHRRWVKMVSGQ
jgi:hypothetical protein